MMNRKMLAALAAALMAASCAGGNTGGGYQGGYVQGGYRQDGYPGNDRDQVWRQRYARTYNYYDDNFYRECRQTADPAGVIGGALIVGLLGNAAGRGRAGATVAGVVVGGALGAALTTDMDCEDRSYAYRTYYDGFNAGRPNARYEWRNPRNDHRGEFEVNNYYDDPAGFRCANYSQTVYVQGRPRPARGLACRQPDGTWTIVN